MRMNNAVSRRESFAPGSTVAAQVASLPPLSVMLGGGEPIAKPPLNLDHSSARLREAASTGPPAVSEDFVNETTVWKRIESSLSLPALYRSREDLRLTLRMLRRVRFFDGLTEEELMTVANCMKIEGVTVQGYVIWEKKGPALEVPESDAEESNSDADEVERLLLGIEERERQAERENKQRKSATTRGSGTSSMLGNNKEPSPSFSSSRFRSPTTMEEHSVASGISSLPADYPDQPVHILIRGKVLLEIPTLNGMQHYPVLPLDTFGNELWTEALPVGSKYLSAEPCTVVVLAPGDQKINRVLARADRLMLEEQKRYLRDHLKVKIFESWLESDFERCAKCFVPLRLESFQVVIEEGELSDCLYFLKEGQLTVTRLVKPHHKKMPRVKPRALPRDGVAHRTSAASPLIRQIRDPSLTPSEHVMQVASLNPGEFFGELGLLAHDPDVRPGENVVWTDRYWTDALSSRFRQVDVVAEASFVKVLRGDEAGSANSRSTESMSEVEEQRDDSDVDIRYPQNTTLRMATVYAQLPSLVYRLSFDDCRAHIGGIALTRLMEFVKGYPAHDEIYEQFEKQLKWTVYRDEFIGDVLRQHKRDHLTEHLPNLKIR